MSQELTIGIKVADTLPLIYVRNLLEAARCAAGNREKLEEIKQELIFAEWEVKGLLDDIYKEGCHDVKRTPNA